MELLDNIFRILFMTSIGIGFFGLGLYQMFSRYHDGGIYLGSSNIEKQIFDWIASGIVGLIFTCMGLGILYDTWIDFLKLLILK